jgi:hypothetical protein
MTDTLIFYYTKSGKADLGLILQPQDNVITNIIKCMFRMLE